MDTAFFGELKSLISSYTGLERDALHVHIALLLYILAMVVFRQTRRSRIPWLVVLVIQLANEANDLLTMQSGTLEGKLADSTKDVWNTMLWPTVLLFVGRYTDLFRRREGRDSEHQLRPEDESGRETSPS